MHREDVLVEKASIKYCRHVYENLAQDICPDCGGYTHSINWKDQNDQHKEWISSGKATVQGWSSI
jgi:hypothetical protein